MKNAVTFQKLLVIALSILSFNAKPNSTPGNSLTPSPEKAISSLFKFPRVLIPYSQSKKTLKVEVVFVTDSIGRVNYANAKTADRALKSEIEKQFFTFRLPGVTENTAHRVVLNFSYLDKGI